jgi:hypothetical protein
MSNAHLIPAERIERRILLLRGEKVMLDFDLAELYGVATKTLNQAVKRNLERFPADFMFPLSEEEALLIMRSQIVTSSGVSASKSTEPPPLLRSQIVTSSQKKRRSSHRPYAFTEQGVAMLSSVLRSPRAVQVNIAIMRTFVQLRQMLATHADLARKLAALEAKYDAQFKVVFDAIRELMREEKPSRREIGFHTAAPRSGGTGALKARRASIVYRKS